MKQKEGFGHYLNHKKYTYREIFLEPVLALPFAYVLLRILEGTFNTLTFILIFIMVLIYLPTLVVFLESPKK